MFWFEQSHQKDLIVKKNVLSFLLSLKINLASITFINNWRNFLISSTISYGIITTK